MRAFELHGIRFFAVHPDGPPFHTESDAIDLITAAVEADSSFVLLPVERFDADFFNLRRRSLGEFVQKFVMYKRRIAFVGDISSYLTESSSLRAFVREANEGNHVWFVADMDELADRLADET
jgi:Domain of unknown function (DUF4180)